MRYGFEHFSMDESTPINANLNYFDVGNPVALDAIADSLARGLPLSSTMLDVVITIPAHNEEDYITQCIESIAHQRNMYGQDIDTRRFEVLVLCHNCTDMTYRNALAAKTTYPELNLCIFQTNRPEVNNVGSVRRVLMRMASLRLSSRKGFIAMTDADTIVHSYWLNNLYGYIDSEYALICGKIEIDTKNVSKTGKIVLALKRRYDELWVEMKDAKIPELSNPSPRHLNNSGPNMAVRADIYTAVGGIEPLGFCEDIAFYDKIVYAGYRVRHCPMTIVSTSGRTVPRTPWGFGAELSIWNHKNADLPVVEGLAALLERLRIYHSLLSCSIDEKSFHFRNVLRHSGIEEKLLLKFLQESPANSSLILKMEKFLDGCENWRARHAKVDIKTACEEIEDYKALTPEVFSQISKR